MTHINFCLHRNQHYTNKHVDTSTTYTRNKQKSGKQPVEGSTNKRDTNAYCIYLGTWIAPSKDESIPKGSTDTEHDMNNSILHPPHTGPVSWANHMTPSPTVNRGHSQEMTSVTAVHTLHTKPRDGSTRQSVWVALCCVVLRVTELTFCRVLSWWTSWVLCVQVLVLFHFLRDTKVV